MSTQLHPQINRTKIDTTAMGGAGRDGREGMAKLSHNHTNPPINLVIGIGPRASRDITLRAQ